MIASFKYFVTNYIVSDYACVVQNTTGGLVARSCNCTIHTGRSTYRLIHSPIVSETTTSCICLQVTGMILTSKNLRLISGSPLMGD